MAVVEAFEQLYLLPALAQMIIVRIGGSVKGSILRAQLIDRFLSSPDIRMVEAGLVIGYYQVACV